MERAKVPYHRMKVRLMRLAFNLNFFAAAKDFLRLRQNCPLS